MQDGGPQTTAGKSRRRRRLAGACALLILAGAAALALRGGTSPAPPAGSLHAALVPDLDAHPPRIPGVGVLGLRNIRRLIALGRPVYCGGRHGRELAFTFDDGPGVYTHYALRKLARHRQRATFFVVGRSVRAWPGWLARESRVAALGDHTMTHRDLVALSPAGAAQEIYGAQRLIERDTGRPVVLFRPPYGAHDQTVDRIVRRLGMLEVMWSVDSGDSLGAGYRQIIRNVEPRLRPGAIVELHENRGQTIRALGVLLPELRRRHLRSVSLITLLATDPPSAAQLRRGEAGCAAPARAGARRGAE